MTRFQHYEVPEGLPPWRAKINEIIFGAETFAGKMFDIVLIVAIVISVASVLADSVASLNARYGHIYYWVEWFFTILFTIEYALRLISVKRPARYAFSFYGLVDLFSIIPTYVSLLIPGASSLLVIRVLRILRIFRVLKLMPYVGEAELMIRAIRQSRRKIFVFLYTVLTLVIVFGAIMYLIEGPEHGFTSIPQSMYWAIVTLTTVGYGDIAPQTFAGQFVAAGIMVCGYSIIAVPTGIYVAEMANMIRTARDARGCPGCGKTGHDVDAAHCKYCGEALNPVKKDE